MMPATLDAAAVAVLSWLLTYAVHSTILLAIAALAAWRFSEHHAWLDQIWKAALIAPLLTASLPDNGIAVPRWEIAAATSTAGATLAAEGDPSIAPPPPAQPDQPASQALPASPALPAPPARPVPPALNWPLMVSSAWLLAACVLAGRYAVRLRRVYRALGSGSPMAPGPLPDGFASIKFSTNHQCPIPLALTSGRIVLPPRFHEELDSEQQQAALAHEVAHVIRRDPEWRIALELLERVLFFQPLNRFARARLCDSAEFLCDEWAVQQTQSPLALARCLSIVASWWSPADSLPAGVSAMARSESAMVRRVTRILDAPARAARPRAIWLAIPVALVAIAAPRITAAQLPAPVTASVAAVLATANTAPAAEQRDTRTWTPAEIDTARAQLNVNRFDRSAATLKDRWFQALADAGKRGVNDFWIVYTFTTRVHRGDFIFSDTRDGISFTSNGRISVEGPPLSAVISPGAVQLEGGNVAVLLHYRRPRPDGLDRAGCRSVEFGFDFGRTPIYWLGDAPEAQSFERATELFAIERDRKLQLWLVGLAALHPNSTTVIPFLTSLVDSRRPAEIRAEAAEGFEYHHDPRSVEVLLRVARNDADADVRSEAAEAIGEVQTPQSIPALTTLVNESTDDEVRREAAEGFGAQPAAQAIPAIERVVATSQHGDVLNEAIEALGDLGDQSAVPVLVQIVNTHASRQARIEAVETLGDLGGPAVVDALTRIAWEHNDVEVQREAVETLGDRRDDPGAIAAIERIIREHDREEVQAEAIETLPGGNDRSLHPLILDLAISGRTARLRSEALDSIGGAVEKIDAAAELDRAQAVIERVVFEDPDRSVQEDALDAAASLPNDRAMRVLRDVIARHPDARIRREAEEHLHERQ